MFKKLTSLILTAAILFTSFGINDFKIYADSSELQPVVEEIIVPEKAPECYSAPKIIGKKALKWAIKNTTEITNLIGKHFGKEAAINSGKYMHSYIKPVLIKLETVDKLTYGQLNSAIYNSLSGVAGSGTARVIANGVVFVIEFFAPI